MIDEGELATCLTESTKFHITAATADPDFVTKVGAIMFEA